MCIKEIMFGAYTATYDGVDIGIAQSVYEIQNTANIQTIQADYYGDADIEGIYRGMNVNIVVTFLEWLESIRDATWTPAETYGVSGVHGRCMTDMAKPLILTATAGTPAAGSGKQSSVWTFPLASIQPGHQLTIPLGNTERALAMAFKVWPQLGTGSELLYYTHL